MDSILKLLPLSLFLPVIVSQPPYSKLRWVPAKDVEFSYFHSEPAGYILNQNLPLSVGRTLFNKGLMVGSYNYASSGQLSFHYNDSTPTDKPKSYSIGKASVQILVHPPGTVSWQPKRTGDGKIPTNMILGGVYPTTKEHTFICRGVSNSALLIGYYRLIMDTCLVDWGMKGFSLTEFQVMSLNYYGMASGAGAD